MRVLLRHRGCGKPAFYADHKLILGEVMEAKYFTLLDGTTPFTGGLMECGSCGYAICDPVMSLTQEEVVDGE